MLLKVHYEVPSNLGPKEYQALKSFAPEYETLFIT